MNAKITIAYGVVEKNKELCVNDIFQYVEEVKGMLIEIRIDNA